MELKITGKNTEVTPELRQYINKRIGKLDRHLSNILESKVEIAEEKTRSPQHRFIVQVTFDCSGTLLRGEERAEDFPTAIDKVASVMDRQIADYKGKRYNKKGNASVARTTIAPVETVAESTGKVVKVKQFAVKLMTEDEAIEQMELLGHDFFLFLNNDGGKMNLLYRRTDKNYGLIEPRFD